MAAPGPNAAASDNKGAEFVMDEDLKLRDVLDIVHRRRRLILTVLASGMAAALLFLMIATPRYTAEATLKFDPRQFQIASEDKNVGPDLFERLIAGEIAVIQSPEVLQKVVVEQGLSGDPELTRVSWLGLVRRMFSGGNAALDHEQAQANALREAFLAQLTVEQPPRSNLISVAFTSEDPIKAARITNALVNVYLAKHLENRLDSNPLASRWLGDRKSNLRERWRASEKAVEAFKATNNLRFIGGESLKEQQISQLNAQLVQVGGEVENIRARVEQIRRLMQARDYDQLANVVQSDVMTRLRERYAITSQQEAALATTLLTGHPRLQQIRSQTRTLREHIASEGRRSLENLEVQFQATKERQKLIQANLDALIGGVRETSGAVVKLRELERTAASDKAIYEAFLKRSNETMEQASGQFANFTLVKKAQVPLRPSFPSKLKVLLLALAASLLAGVGAAFLLETLFDRFRTKVHVTAALKLPHLASLPELKGADLWTRELARQPERLIAFNPQSAFAQATGGLRVALGLQSGGTAPKTLAVCSANTGEGKTMVASAIAQHAALEGQKTLLIDCDFRAPALGRLFEPSGEGEPIDLAAAARRVDTPLLHDAHTGLDVMPAIADPAHAASFLRGPEFADLLGTAKHSYDLVVLDTSALNSAPESCVVAGLADATLLVVEWNKTRQDVAIDAISQLEASNARPVGVVLNRADVAALAETNDFVPQGRFPKPAFGAGRGRIERPAPARPFEEGLFGGAGE